MPIAFTKMHGLGNDFVIIETLTQEISVSDEWIRFVADRKLGVGCDQVLFLNSTTNQDADFNYQIFNADGTEVAQCGNGARCIAKFAYDKGFTSNKVIRFNTKDRILSAEIESNDEVTVDMGQPCFTPADIPFKVNEQKKQYVLAGPDGERIEALVLSLGNPHLIILVKQIISEDVARYGRFFNQHNQFPLGVNVGFMQVISSGSIKMRIYERGVGETLACGSAACAGVVAGHMLGLLDEAVFVALRGGSLTIRQSNYTQAVLMRGPAVTVFDGIFSD